MNAAQSRAMSRYSRPMNGVVMAKKSRSEQARNDKGIRGSSIVAAGAAVLVIALVAATYLNESDDTPPAQTEAAMRDAALASEHSPTLGNPDAKVHIIEFLDPACETCALFFPMVKQWMADLPNDLRLSIRHVAFHTGSDYALRVLEASRKQDKYWETLEALLTTQNQWVQHHVVQPDRIAPAIAAVGLDMEQLTADMNSVAVMQRIEQDKKDSIFLKVSATPEYYVNGRPLSSFGQQQLADLIRDELSK
jgi:protein-disulfide isomerase